MSYYRTVPTYKQALVTSGVNDASWYRYFQDSAKGVPTANETSITVGVSPFTYIASHGGSVIVSGGTVSLIQFTRTGTYTTGLTAGMFPVALGDKITVTWSGKPSMTFVPS